MVMGTEQLLSGFHMDSIQPVTQIKDDESGFSLTASHLLEYLFCPRFTYFEYVLDIPQHEAKRFKVEVGRTIHEKIRDTRGLDIR